MNSPKYSRLAPGQRRDQILDAANALFAERAYDAVSIEDIASSAGVTRGLVHHYFGGRKEVYIGLLERIGAQREDQLRPPVGRSARARVADSVSRWLDWTETNRTIWLATIARGEDIADPDVRHVVADLVHRAVSLLTAFHADIAQDSPRLRYALQCWTALNRAATRRWLRGQATREDHARAAHLHAGTHPAHLRLPTRATQAHMTAVTWEGSAAPGPRRTTTGFRTYVRTTSLCRGQQAVGWYSALYQAPSSPSKFSSSLSRVTVSLPMKSSLSGPGSSSQACTTSP